jgi:hypothetical protein
MDKNKFQQVLNQHAEKWYVDANAPMTWGLDEPRKRVLKSGEEREVNTTGFPQVTKWFPVISHCQRCDEFIANKIEELNIHKRTTKCNCKQKFGWDVCHPFKLPNNLTDSDVDV